MPSSDSQATSTHSSTVRALPRKGDLVDVRIERIDDRGRGAADTFGSERPLTMRFANPGALVRARVLGRRKTRIDAQVMEVLEPGPFASPARCDHAGTCGGCALPRLDPAEQLSQKQRLVEEAIARAFELPNGTEPNYEVRPIVGATRLTGYRNKMEFSFGARRYVLADEPQGAPASFALGLHAPGLYWKVLDVHGCAIAGDLASSIVRTARREAIARGLEPWDERSHTGLLRHLVIRRSERTDQTMVDLVTSERAAERIEPYAEAILRAHPEISTFVQNITTRLAKVAYGEEEHVLHGPGYIEEEICGKRFKISADSFFQTNTEQAEVLFEMVRRAAALKDGDTLYDLYCGAGSIGICIGDSASRIIGIESSASAVRDARANAERNGVTNIEFHEGDALHLFGELPKDAPPDVAIVDPPRAGLHPKVPALIGSLGAPRLVYVSCSPRSGARDVAMLCKESGYRLTTVEPIDLFPNTPHVETVLTLERDPR